MQELISSLTSQLGIGEGQAKGGLGLIMNLAKDKLDGGDFSKVADLLGGESALGQLAQFIPSSSESSSAGGLLGAVSAMASNLGGDLGNLGNLGQLISGFKALDLDADSAKNFASIAGNFLKEKGGSDITGLLSKFL